jgi:hypothetical protein
VRAALGLPLLLLLLLLLLDCCCCFAVACVRAAVVFVLRASLATPQLTHPTNKPDPKPNPKPNPTNSQRHHHGHTMPATIRGWVREVQAQLSSLADWPEAQLPTEEKLVWFRWVVGMVGWVMGRGIGVG